MYNPWLSRSQKRVLTNDLKQRFLNYSYLEVCHDMTQFACGHPDWQRSFVVHINVDSSNNIDEIEIRELER